MFEQWKFYCIINAQSKEKYFTLHRRRHIIDIMMFFLVERSTRSRVENIFNEPPTGIIFGRRHTFLYKERERKEKIERKRVKHSRFFPSSSTAIRLHLIVATTWPNKYFSLRHDVRSAFGLFTIIFVVDAFPARDRTVR